MGLVPVSPLGHFTKWKWLWRKLLLTSGGWQGGQQALVWLLLPCTGVERTALVGGSGQDCRGSLIRGSPHPQVSGTTGRLARGSRQIGMSFRLLPPVMPQCEPSRGAVQMTLRAMCCVHHTLILLGCLAELLWIWPKAATVIPHQSKLKDHHGLWFGKHGPSFPGT